MKWKGSLLGDFIDMKVAEFEFPNTAVFLTRWYDFETATDDLDGFRYIWFKHANSPYTDRESVATFFVSVDDREEGDCVLKMFRECPYFFYGRFYENQEAVKALRNFTEKV